MTETHSKTGRDLNATFLPGSLLRKSEKKLTQTLAQKCTVRWTQMNFKKQQGTTTSRSTRPKSSSRATSWRRATRQQ